MVDGTLITAAQHNSNYSDIKTAFNTSAVLTDVAKVITVSHTWAASQTIAGATLTGDLLFSLDGNYDIGKIGATRPRDIWNSRDITIGGQLAVGAAKLSWGTFFAGRIDIGGYGSIVAGTGAFGTQVVNDAYFDDVNWKYQVNGTPGQLYLSVGELVFTNAPAGVGGNVLAWTERFRITLAGDFKLGTAVSRLVPGATSFAIRNNANTRDNLLLTDAGALTIFDAIRGARYLDVNGNQVLTIRDAGWTPMTNTTNKATAYDTTTVTLPQLASRVKAMQDVMTNHGMIGA
jgi:hypothetical protein